VQSDPPVAVEDRPRRAELDRRGDRKPERQPDDDHEGAHDEVERPLDEPVRAGEDGRAQLEQRDALAGDVLGALGQQV
jgi:hypothetical protein